MGNSRRFFILAVDDSYLSNQVIKLMDSKGIDYSLINKANGDRSANRRTKNEDKSTTSRRCQFINQLFRLISNFYVLFLDRLGRIMIWARVSNLVLTERRSGVECLHKYPFYSCTLFSWDEDDNLTIRLRCITDINSIETEGATLVLVGVNISIPSKINIHGGEFQSIFLINYNEVLYTNKKSLDAAHDTLEDSANIFVSNKLKCLPVNLNDIASKLSHSINKSGVLIIADEMPKFDRNNIYFTLWREYLDFRNLDKFVFCVVDTRTSIVTMKKYDCKLETASELTGPIHLDILPLLDFLSSFFAVINLSNSTFFPFEEVCALLEIEFANIQSSPIDSSICEQFLLTLTIMQRPELGGRETFVKSNISSIFHWQKWADEVFHYMIQDADTV